MEILKDINPHSSRRTKGRSGYAAAIGFFDGVHRGHQFLLRQVKAEAAQRGLRTMAITFSAHPRQTLRSDYQPELITTNEEKLQLLEECGLDACALLDFTPEMAAMPAREFMETYLSKLLGVLCLVIGYDHRFGSDRAEGFLDYALHGRKLGMDVVKARPFDAGDLRVSSSAVRRFLSGGNVEMAKICLGRPYALRGTVVEGRHVGRGLGFPTANLQPCDPEKILPGRGVYAVQAETGGRTYGGMLNIGWRPTLDNGKDASVEAHLFGFEGSLYGKPLTLLFEHRLRDEQRFGSLEELQEQLREDAIRAKRFLDK